MLIAYVVYFLAISAGLFILLKKRQFSLPFIWVGIYMLASGVIQLAAKVVYTLFGSNVLFYKSTVPLTLLIIFFLFHSLIGSRQLRKWLIVFCAIAEGAILFQMAQSFNSVLSMSNTLVVYNVGVISFCLLYFLNLLRTPVHFSLFRQGTFWIVSGFFFYFLSSFAFWFSGLLFTSSNKYLGVLNILLVILFYLIVWVGIFVHLRENRNYGITGK